MLAGALLTDESPIRHSRVRITMQQVLELVKTFFPDDYRRLGQGSLNQKQLLEQHRTHIIQKINGYGGYDDLDVSAIIEASQREHILKKYIWVVSMYARYIICQSV